MVKQLLILIIFSSVCHGQTKEKYDFQDISYKDITEIKGLIYTKADTTLVTGKVIRYNRKKEAKSYIFVTKGKPDIRGWTQYNNTFERPKESVLGQVFFGAAAITGAVMAVTGNDLNGSRTGKAYESNVYGKNQKDYYNKAYNEMSSRNDISNSLASNKEENKSSKIDDKNDRTKVQGKFVDEKKDGVSEEYYKNGQLRSKGVYAKGKREGLWEEYYENGSLESQVKFEEGKKVGLLKRYHSNGQLLGRINYKNGKEHGVIEAYYENGQLMMIGQFQDGKQIGEWRYYNEKGKLSESENYDN